MRQMKYERIIMKFHNIIYFRIMSKITVNPNYGFATTEPHHRYFLEIKLL